MKRYIAFQVFILIALCSLNAQVDKKYIRSGNKAFKKGEYSQAIVDYGKSLVVDSTSVAGNYNLANVLMKTENPQEAQKIYEALADTVKMEEKEIKSRYNHNIGNSYLEQKQYQQAIDSYKESLRNNPSDMETKSNLAYAQKMLENEQNQDNNDQNQDDQNKDDQNKDGQNNDDQNKNDQKDDKGDNDKKDDKQDQNDQQNQDPDQQNKDQQKQDEKGDAPPPKITPQAAQQMLQAIEDKEKETQEKVNKEKAKLLQSRQKEKNW